MHIQQLILQTSQPGTLQEFYGDLLGFQIGGGTNKDLIIQAGYSELVFTSTDAGNPFYHFAFTIPANKIEEAKAWLTGKVELLWIEDYKSDIADFVNWHARSVYFYDPAGNIVEFIARSDLDNSTDTPFSARQVVSISEAGLVFPADELNSRTDKLLEQCHLSYFDKQPPLPQFKAVGDDHGLFIIVPEHRNWYPTSTPSGIFPMTVKFSNGDMYEFNSVRQ